MFIKKLVKKLGWLGVGIFILINLIAFFHAYQFTHFTELNIKKTKAVSLTKLEKLEILFFGIKNPRPTNTKTPSQAYETIKLQSNKQLEAWFIKSTSNKGTVILFHGYGGKKSALLDKATLFLNLGYHVFLVDFMGSGGSEGVQTTIGYHEAEQVKTCFEYVLQKRGGKIYLFGTSMGAVAIMKALHDYPIQPQGIILECPFGSMQKTTAARFTELGIPSFPMANLLVFWGGVQNGFWAFSHNPEEYAKKITCPTLLLYGEKDKTVSREEIDAIFSNLSGTKKLKTYPLAGHENYLNKYKKEWLSDVKVFMGKL